MNTAINYNNNNNNNYIYVYYNTLLYVATEYPSDYSDNHILKSQHIISRESLELFLRHVDISRLLRDVNEVHMQMQIDKHIYIYIYTYAYIYIY